MDIFEALWQDDDRMSGAVCFRGTRIPVYVLFEYLSAGRMEEFYSGYPNVTKEQIDAVLSESSAHVEAMFSKEQNASKK